MRTINNIKLGVFVLAGLAFLIALLYMIGRNSNLFQSTYSLKAQFDNIQGLVVGNNVRFAGIESGTVRRIKIINDSIIEVTMIIDRSLKQVIRRNAIASIGSEGLVGNKVLNITPSLSSAPFAEEDDVIASKKTTDVDEMLHTLGKTSIDVAAIASELRTTVKRINNSLALWELLKDKSIPRNIAGSLENIHRATSKSGDIVNRIDSVIMDIRLGHGSVGALVKDTVFATNLNMAMIKLSSAATTADSLGIELRALVGNMDADISNGNGAANALFKDTAIVRKLHAGLDNLQKGTDGFNQNMEALKHSFLFRGYFKKIEKQKKKAAHSTLVSE